MARLSTTLDIYSSATGMGFEERLLLCILLSVHCEAKELLTDQLRGYLTGGLQEVRKGLAAATDRKWWYFWRSDISSSQIEAMARSAVDEISCRKNLSEDVQRAEKLRLDLKHVMGSLIREKLPNFVGMVRSRTTIVRKECVDKLMEQYEFESGDLTRKGLQEMKDVAVMVPDAPPNSTRGSTEGPSELSTRFGLKVVKCMVMSSGAVDIEAMEEYSPQMPLWQVDVEQLVASKASLRSARVGMEKTVVPEVSSIGSFPLCASLSVKAAWLWKGNLVMAVQSKKETSSEILVWDQRAKGPTSLVKLRHGIKAVYFDDRL